MSRKDTPRDEHRGADRPRDPPPERPRPASERDATPEPPPPPEPRWKTLTDPPRV